MKSLVTKNGFQFVSYYPQGWSGTPSNINNFLWTTHTNYPMGDLQNTLLAGAGQSNIVGQTISYDGLQPFPSRGCTSVFTGSLPAWSTTSFANGYLGSGYNAAVPCLNPLSSGGYPSTIDQALSAAASLSAANRQWTFIIAGESATGYGALSNCKCSYAYVTGVSGVSSHYLWDNPAFRAEVARWIAGNPGAFLTSTSSGATTTALSSSKASTTSSASSIVSTSSVTVSSTSLGESTTTTTPTTKLLSTPVVDGSTIVTHSNPLTSDSITLTTKSSNDIVVVAVVVDNLRTVSGVRDGAGLAWHREFSSGGLPDLEVWNAYATSALASDQIVVSFSGTSLISDSIAAFGISGANTGSPFDGVIAHTTGTSRVASATVTTSSLGDLLIGVAVNSQGAGASAGQGLAIIGSNTAPYALGVEGGGASTTGNVQVPMTMSKYSIWSYVVLAIK